MRQDIFLLQDKLKTSIQDGLSSEEASKRLKKDGLNVIAKTKKVNWFIEFFNQFKEPMLLILIIASIVSIFLKEFVDGIIILVVVIMNALIGFIQEKKAYKALESLKNLSSPHSKVIRDSKLQEISSFEVVKGDLLYFEEGDIIPSDCRIVSLNGLKVNESSLTGESLPVVKCVECETSDLHRLDILYATSEVVEGNCYALCYATSLETEIGKIALLTMKKKDKTPLENKLDHLSKVLGLITLIICLVMFTISLIRKENFFDTLISSISLGVAAIPEGLPAVVTIVLSLGVQKMVKYNAIVSKLKSVETLGSVTMVCSDKTGTLTENKMIIEKGYFDKECLDFTLYKKEISLFMLCSSTSKKNKDPLERAIQELGHNLNIDKDNLNLTIKRLKEIPFSSERKCMTTFHDYKGEKFSIIKGAPEVILEKCKYISLNNTRLILKEDLKKIESKIETYSLLALRVIALCIEYENKTIFVGLLAFKDPLRKEAKDSVKEMLDAHIKVKMITGDHKNTAFAIAKEVGIASSLDEVIEGKEIDILSDDELKERLKKVTTFARVTPLHKLEIVKAYKSMNEVVAMTGDGVNDAPSLKEADVGIAMGKSGTDVAKEASDIVLQDDRFLTIVKAIEEGRTIYANIKKAILFLLSSNIAEVMVMFFALLLNMPLPLLAIHILFVNLVSDSLPGLSLGVDKKEKDVMKQKPRQRNETIFAQGGVKILASYSFIIFSLSIFAYFLIPLNYLKNYQINDLNTLFNALQDIFNSKELLKRARTYAFLTLSLSELFHMIGMSSVKESLLTIIKKKNYMLLLTFIVGFFLHYLIIQVPFLASLFKVTPLQLSEWLIIIILSSFPLIFHEIIRHDFR